MRWLKIVLLSMLLFACSEESRWPKEKFEPHLWQTTAVPERYRFVRDLIASKTLVGKTRPEVLALLGPSSPSEDDYLQYVIKLEGYGFNQNLHVVCSF